MALLPIFCVARSSRTDLSMLVARAKIGRIADGARLDKLESISGSKLSAGGHCRQHRVAGLPES